MYKPIQITKDIFYTGVNDRTKHLFENLWPLPLGVSYNAYLISDEKTALIDTVDLCYSDVFFQKIISVIGSKPVDYLIVNHMEPDHSGSIAWLITKFPNIRIVGNKRTLEMLKGFYGIDGENVLLIQDMDELSLGSCTLRFYLTPMVHWPETMMTYVPERKTLFSGDAFGTFGTLDGGVLDRQLMPERYREEMIRYYSNIVGKFGSPVQTALKKLSAVEIDVICSTHGPVWTQKENIREVVELYDRLSRYESEPALVIAYGSMYGHTEQLAEIIATSAAEQGLKKIVMHNVSKSHESDILRDVFAYSGLIIGSPTYNNKLYPAVEKLISAMQSRYLKNRFFGCFGSFSWSDATAKQLSAFAEESGFEIVADPVVMKQAMLQDVVEKARNLGQNMACKLLSGAAVVPNNTEKCH